MITRLRSRLLPLLALLIFAATMAVTPAQRATAWAGGDTPPTSTLVGTTTGLNKPYAVAFDTTGNMYVSNNTSDEVTVNLGGATGNTAPIRTISTGISGPEGIAFDPSGNLYVANDGDDSISVYAPGTSTPTRTLTGANTDLATPVGIDIDAQGKVYVANNGGGVTQYPPLTSWQDPGATPCPTTCNQAPDNEIAALPGPASPTALTLDAAGNTYVGGDNNTVVVYAAGWTSSSSTMKTLALSGSSTPYGLAFDAAENFYVVNNDAVTPSVSAFAANWTTGATPYKTLVGTNTNLFGGYGIAFDSSGYMYVTIAQVAGSGTPAVNVYAPDPSTVTFSSNGGTGSMAPQSSIGPAVLNSNQFARSGYTFTGWNSAANGSGTNYAYGSSYNFAANLTLYAQWQASGSVKAQNPRNHCVTPPGSLRVITTRQLMKAKCRTNANQAVGVTVELVEPGTGGRSLVAERGDVAAFHLFCGSAESAHNTNSTGRSDRSRYCRSGSLQISTPRSGWRLRVKWSAPATSTYSAYRAGRTYTVK